MIRIAPQSSNYVTQLAQSLMNRPAPPVSGIASGITALGQPLAAGLMARMGQQQQQQQKEAETSAFGQMLEEANRARQAGQDPVQAVNAMAAVQEGPGWGQARERFMQIAQQGLAKSLLGGQQQQPFTLGPGQKRFGPGGQLVAAVPPAPTTPKPPQVREVKQGDNIVTQQFDPNKGQWTTISTAPRYKPQEGAAYQPQTPEGKLFADRRAMAAQYGENSPVVQSIDKKIAQIGKSSDAQTKAAGFADRMIASGDTLDRFDELGTSMRVAAVEDAPGGSYFLGEDEQAYVQAKRDFINAQLRRESGAVIGPSEFENANKQYFPQPGDSPKVIAQKRRNRLLAVKGMMRSAGPAYEMPERASISATAPVPPARPDIAAPPPAPDVPTVRAQMVPTPSAAPSMEGRTATGPNGEKLINRGGQWVRMR